MLTSIYWVEWAGLTLVGLLENEEMKMLPTFGSVSLNRSLVAPQRGLMGFRPEPSCRDRIPSSADGPRRRVGHGAGSWMGHKMKQNEASE